MEHIILVSDFRGRHMSISESIFLTQRMESELYFFGICVTSHSSRNAEIPNLCWVKERAVSSWEKAFIYLQKRVQTCPDRGKHIYSWVGTASGELGCAWNVLLACLLLRNLQMMKLLSAATQSNQTRYKFAFMWSMLAGECSILNFFSIDANQDERNIDRLYPTSNFLMNVCTNNFNVIKREEWRWQRLPCSLLARVWWMCSLNFIQQAVLITIRTVCAAFLLSVARDRFPYPWAQHSETATCASECAFSDSTPQKLVGSGCLSTANAVLIHLITVAIHSYSKLSDKFNRKQMNYLVMHPFDIPSSWQLESWKPLPFLRFAPITFFFHSRKHCCALAAVNYRQNNQSDSHGWRFGWSPFAGQGGFKQLRWL